MKISPKQLLLQTLCPLLLLLVQQTALAQSGPARVQLERFSQGLESLQANFGQKVIGSDGAVEDESTGQVWLSRPHRFRWEYAGDFPEQVVADGEHVWLYDEVLEQVTVRDQSGLSADSPLTLLTDLSLLDEQFEVRELGENNGMLLLELRALSEDSEFERVLLGMQDDTLLLMAMEDAFGLRTEIQFHGIQRNPSLDMNLFQFDPPPGTDVIGDWPAVPDLGSE